MKNEQVTSDSQSLAVLIRSLRPRVVAPRVQVRFQWSNWLGWRQWLVLFGMGLAVIAIEVRNHNHMWQEHSSGQTIWTDHELIWEIILFGLVFPIVAGISLEYMGRTAIERNRIAKELALRRELVGKIHEAQGWHELAEVIVTTPGGAVSADRAWLLAQRYGDDAFEQIARWERPGSGLMPSHPPVAPAACAQCERASSLKGTRILNCPSSSHGSASVEYARYCLWLSSEGTGKAALLFDMPSDRLLSTDQVRALDDLGDEISLAIDKSNLLNEKKQRVDAARNERLRIARDLHDTLGQNVSYLRLKLEQLSVSLLTFERSEFQDELARMLVVADEVYEQVRDTLEELRTTEHRDLQETIRLYATQVTERSDVSVWVQTSGQPATLSSRKSRQLMYIVREALNNVEKHANAQNVDIQIGWSDDELRLTVRDDGKGFRTEEVSIEDSYGITIMQERAQALNSNLAIESNPGEGTELTLSLPLSTGSIVASRGQ